MKKLVLIILSVTVWLQLNAQFHSVSLDVFQPIVSSGMLQFYNTNNAVKQYETYSRNYTAVGSSATIQYAFNSLLIGYRFGIVQRNLQESNMTQSEGFDDDGNLVADALYTSYSYNQKHIVQIISCGKEQSFENITMGIHAEIPLILYGKGHAKYFTHYNLSSDILSQIQTIGSGFGSGIGVGIAFSYAFTPPFWFWIGHF